MPTYDYKCPICGKTKKDEFIKLADLEMTEVICCDAEMERQISASPINFNCSMPTEQRSRDEA